MNISNFNLFRPDRTEVSAPDLPATDGALDGEGRSSFGTALNQAHQSDRAVSSPGRSVRAKSLTQWRWLATTLSQACAMRHPLEIVSKNRHTNEEGQWLSNSEVRNQLTEMTESSNLSYPAMVHKVSKQLQSYEIDLSPNAGQKLAKTIQRYEDGKIGNAGAHKAEVWTFAEQVIRSISFGEFGHALVSATGVFANSVGVMGSVGVSVQTYPRNAVPEDRLLGLADRFAATFENFNHVASDEAMDQRL